MCEKVHPFLMGHGFAEAFPELVEIIGPVFNAAVQTGRTVDVGNIPLFVMRNGYLEEAYFTGQFIPIRGDSGEVEGFYNTSLECTSQVLQDRRRIVTDQIAAIVPRSVDETFSLFIEAISTNPHDITAAMIYTFDKSIPDGTNDLHLRGSVGIPHGHRSSIAHARLDTCQDGLVPLLRHVRSTGEPYMADLEKGDPLVPKGLLDGVDWRGFGEPSRTLYACLIPISEDVLGFYVQGLNPRREHDEAAERSIRDTTTQLAAKWATAIAKEESHKREIDLKRRAADSENRLRNMASHAPVGMVQIGLDSRIQWANDQFYEIIGCDRSMLDIEDLLDILASEERDPNRDMAKELLDGAPRVTREVRLAKEWTPPNEAGEVSTPCSAWILTVTFPMMKDGKVEMLLGYVVDISRQKWAEDVKAMQAEEALSSKRRQEEFLDVTSHELRNPLSAITQLADGIARSLENGHDDDLNSWRQIARESAEAANTILACASHQKRIIDDVLVLSRLDSQLLSITPTATQPSHVVESTIKMFEGISALNNIEISARRGADSRELLGLDCIFVDASRLMQILINLISNSIKFTASRDVRKISVTHGLRSHRPSHLATPFGNLEWVPSSDVEGFNSELLHLGTGEGKLYVYFLVQDTAQGLAQDEIQRLFKRFSQATTKTHVAYGGSGLGLYISRKLAERQGGQIGVASKAGEGSVFAFYLETKAMKAAEQKVESSKLIVDGLIKGTPKRQGYHVLLVEDNIVNQKVLKKQLERAKCTVAVANHGLEALEILEKSEQWRTKTTEEKEPLSRMPIEVVLMDTEMGKFYAIYSFGCIRHLLTVSQYVLISLRIPCSSPMKRISNRILFD